MSPSDIDDQSTAEQYETWHRRAETSAHEGHVPRQADGPHDEQGAE